MNREELISRLKALDEEVSMVVTPEVKVTIIVVGGSALVIQGYIDRATMDIDIFNDFNPALLSIMEKYDINNRVGAFCDSVAYNYEDRLVKIDIETKCFDYYTMSLEDLVIMKLFSDREKDMSDIREKEVVDNLNWELLDEIIKSGEADNSFFEARYKDFLRKYENYVKECKK